MLNASESRLSTIQVTATLGWARPDSSARNYRPAHSALTFRYFATIPSGCAFLVTAATKRTAPASATAPHTAATAPLLARRARNCQPRMITQTAPGMRMLSAGEDFSGCSASTAAGAPRKTRAGAHELPGGKPGGAGDSSRVFLSEPRTRKAAAAPNPRSAAGSPT